MKATMMLADHAQAVGGKLYLCGGLVHYRSRPHPLRDRNRHQGSRGTRRTRSTACGLELLDADGQPVLMPTPQGLQPLWIEGTLHR